MLQDNTAQVYFVYILNHKCKDRRKFVVWDVNHVLISAVCASALFHATFDSSLFFVKISFCWLFDFIRSSRSCISFSKRKIRNSMKNQRSIPVYCLFSIEFSGATNFPKETKTRKREEYRSVRPQTNSSKNVIPSVCREPFR